MGLRAIERKDRRTRWQLRQRRLCVSRVKGNLMHNNLGTLPQTRHLTQTPLTRAKSG